MMNELSIFVDESGDFGSYEPHAPFYLFTLVFHDQSNSIENQISHLEHGLADVGFDVKHCFPKSFHHGTQKMSQPYFVIRKKYGNILYYLLS